MIKKCYKIKEMLRKLKLKKLNSRKFVPAKLKIFGHSRKFISYILRIFVLAKVSSLKIWDQEDLLLKKVSQNLSVQHHLVFQYLDQRQLWTLELQEEILPLSMFFSNFGFFSIFLVLLVGGGIYARRPPLVLTFRTTAPTQTLTFRLGESEPTVPVLKCISSYLSNFELQFSVISSSESLSDTSCERSESLNTPFWKRVKRFHVRLKINCI